jgi:hypothetical protein
MTILTGFLMILKKEPFQNFFLLNPSQVSEGDTENFEIKQANQKNHM